ncbi:MAG TPA: hypothetical protein VFZ54_07400 [Burkholderiales bacterium]
MVIAALALAGFIAVAFVMPSMAGSKAKEAGAALVAGAEAPQQQVAAAAEKTGKLEGSGAGIKFASRRDANYGELQWLVSENGVIRGWNRDNGLEVTVTPTLQSGKVSWSCRGYPLDAMPASCGGKN